MKKSVIAFATMALFALAGSQSFAQNVERKDSDFVTEYLQPTRIVWESGVENSSAILSHYAGQAALSEKNVMVMKKGSAILVDFGKEIQGRVQIVRSLTGNGPITVRVRMGESVGEAMSDVYAEGATATNDHAMRDLHIQVPSLGVAETNRSGFRFARIDVEDDVELNVVAIRAVSEYRDLPYLGTFNCSNDRLNQIWKTGAYTVQLNMQEYVWDGIKRDRLVWIGDMHPEVTTITTVFGEQPVVKKSLDFIRDITAPDELMNGYITYSMWWLLIQRDLYRYTGNIDYLKQQHDYISKLLDHIRENIDGDKENFKGGVRFIDWPTFSKRDVIHAGLQCVALMSMEAGAEIARVLGDSQMESSCQQTASKLRNYVPDSGGNKQAAALLSISGLGDPEGSESIQVSQEKESISSLCFDKDGFLWMNCGGFLRCINPSDGSTVYSGDKKIAGIRTDAEGGILFVAYEHELTAYSLSSGLLTKIWSIDSDASISSLAKDKNGAIWFATDRGLFRTRDGRNTERIEEVENINLLNYIDSDSATGRLFMGTISRGVYELFPEGGFHHFQHIDITDDSIRDQANIRENDIANVSCQWVDKDGSVWFGTFNHGLLHAVQDHEPELYGEAEGLPKMNIRSIIGDNNGNIWFSTTTLIYRFNKKDKVFSAFNDRHFNEGSYEIGSVTTGPDGKLYFGGNGYLTVIDPDQEAEDEEDIPLYLEYIGVNGEAWSTDISDITLSHRQKTIALRFASPVYVPGKIQGYSWKLEGFDKDWQFGPSGTEALYSYIPAGHYTFKGRVRQQNGEWSSKELSIPVTIKPSFWGSIPARIAYVLITLLLAYGIIQLLSRIKTQKERLILSERREEMKQEQVDFVTNISHEFRTPLSMIVAPAKELSKIDVPDNAKALVNAIVRNADRLNTLSSQILDSNSPEKKEHLEIRYGDIAATVKAMVENFRFASLEKGLTLSISAPESLKGWYDREKIGKIITNLISNAIKYTPSGKSIDVIVREDSGKATVSVSDSGIGIPEEKRARLFERYDRLGAEETSVPGSGIGLSYANSLAMLHKGELSYQPKSPEGSVFSISIPIDKASYNGEMIIEVAEEPENVPSMLTPESDNMKDGTILIAEDSEEIRSFLRTLLSENYRVVTAADGLEAMDNLKLGIPDLVISDIMMPSMNGYELCRAIKENGDWSHVPVILLTAKADATSSIEGLKSGADAYIPKPFDPDYLKAVVESIIRNRRILQDKILNLTSTSVKEEPSLTDEIQISPKDKALLEKIHQIMEENIATEQFGAEEMAAALKMSYSNLYAKMKALTGKTPLFFINNYRMNKAKELLSSKLYTVSEVAYKIGSLSPNTFSRDFKKHFGVTPSSLMKD